MKKRILLTALALILVCALSIMGTVAFLKDQTKTVTNTFIAAGGPGPFVDEVDGVKQFDLKEYEVTQATSGKYTLNNQKEVAENEYKVLPNTTIPKQAFVKLSRTGKTVIVDNETTTYTPAPAYLYLEVVDGLNAEHYTWSVNSDWEKLARASLSLSSRTPCPLPPNKSSSKARARSKSSHFFSKSSFLYLWMRFSSGIGDHLTILGIVYSRKITDGNTVDRRRAQRYPGGKGKCG